MTSLGFQPILPTKVKLKFLFLKFLWVNPCKEKKAKELKLRIPTQYVIQMNIDRFKIYTLTRAPKLNKSEMDSSHVSVRNDVRK